MTFDRVAETLLLGLSAGAAYAVMGMAHNLVFAATGVLNFALGEYLMSGAMAGVFLAVSLGWPLPLALLGAVAFAVVLGGLQERFTVRPALRHGEDGRLLALLATLAFSLGLQAVFALAMKPDPRPFPRLLSLEPVEIAGVAVVPQRMGILALALLTGGLLAALTGRSLTGRALTAVAQDPEAAVMRGIPTGRLSTGAFALSAGLAAVLGFALAPVTLAYPTLGRLFNLKGFIAAALGGIPRVGGALAGGLLLGVTEAFAAEWVGAGYRDAVTFGILIAVLLVRPHGLLPRVGARPV